MQSIYLVVARGKNRYELQGLTTLQSVLICHLPLGLETVAAALVARSVTQRLAINQPFILGTHSPVQGYGSLYAVYRHCAPGAASVFAQASLH